MPRFAATALDRSVLDGSCRLDTVLLERARAAPTQPMPFNFVTDDRGERRRQAPMHQVGPAASTVLVRRQTVPGTCNGNLWKLWGSDGNIWSRQVHLDVQPVAPCRKLYPANRRFYPFIIVGLSPTSRRGRCTQAPSPGLRTGFVSTSLTRTCTT